jgi:indole-3-glycerol phosphate synthase
MAGILGRIIATKREEVAALAERRSVLRARAEAAGPVRPFAAALRRADGAVALIGEYKRRSPSAGSLGGGVGPGPVARAYAQAGASALSVLTDRDYFGGGLADLVAARAAAALPVLRKDFVIDEVQLWEARAAGADAALLIVRVLDDAALAGLLEACRGLDLAALVEVHDAAELERALVAGADIIGINNRDLATFRTHLGLSLALAPHVPKDRLVVAESGIRGPADVERLGEAGVDAVLVGETLMRAADARAVAAGLVGRPRRGRPVAAAMPGG